jgi:hypothetical protein
MEQQQSREVSYKLCMMSRFPLGLVLLTALFADCWAAPQAPAITPDALRVSDDLIMSINALGVGAQIYQCVASEATPVTYGWKLEGPEANLTDAEGRTIAKHYMGPTWEAPDGSKVVGAVMAQTPSPDPGSIAWLLLSAKSTSGLGIFGETRMIRRVSTNGGNPPTASCGVDNVQQLIRVPYTAVYEFYTARPEHP